MVLYYSLSIPPPPITTTATAAAAATTTTITIGHSLISTFIIKPTVSPVSFFTHSSSKEFQSLVYLWCLYLFFFVFSEYK